MSISCLIHLRDAAKKNIRIRKPNRENQPTELNMVVAYLSPINEPNKIVNEISEEKHEDLAVSAREEDFIVFPEQTI